MSVFKKASVILNLMQKILFGLQITQAYGQGTLRITGPSSSPSPAQCQDWRRWWSFRFLPFDCSM